jgi:hypothetical protein
MGPIRPWRKSTSTLMLLQNRPVWRLAFGVRRDWRGAALARAQGAGTFFSMRGWPRYRVKQAAPANCPARSFVSQPVRTTHFAPRDNSYVWTVSGSRLLRTICGHTRAEKNSVRSGGCDQERLASRRPDRQAPNAERRTPNAERQTPNAG